MNTCGHQIPNEATFCPFCGSPNQTPVKVNASGLEALISAAEVDMEEPQVPTRRVWPMVVSVALVALLGLGFLAILPSDEAAPTEEVAEVVESVPVVETAPVLAFGPEKLATAIDGKHGEVRYAGQTLFRIEGAKGSRYKTVEERTEAFRLRVSHAFTTESSADSTPRFIAQMVDGNYEVVWKRADTNFLITDITSEDVKNWEKANGKSSPAILANLVADRLNVMLELGNEIPNS